MTRTFSADGIEYLGLWNGGFGAFVASGDFDAGVLTLEFSADGGTTWSSVGTEAELSASGGTGFVLPPGVEIRLQLSGSGAPNITTKVG